jgi:hypothetical protein
MSTNVIRVRRNRPDVAQVVKRAMKESHDDLLRRLKQAERGDFRRAILGRIASYLRFFVLPMECLRDSNDFDEEAEKQFAPSMQVVG